MQQRPWLHFWDSCNNEAKEEVASALAAAGIQPRAFNPINTTGEGILCFTHIVPELVDLLRDVSDGGRRRIVAVPMSDLALNCFETWDLLGAGASDVLRWSGSLDFALQISARFERWREVDELVSSAAVQSRLIGDSGVWRMLLRQVIETARFTDANVLLIGESGTGKELIASTLQDVSSDTHGKSLVILDCTTVVPELSGSEFFGHERGAFTGAVAARDGAFALASGGTLFLDEVGELPMTLQAQLLRVVQEGTYKRVGSNTWQRTSFRLVCATNRDLLSAIEKGGFRSDLYYRIASWVFCIPPLRERVEDILPLARHFLKQLRPEIENPDFERPVRDFLMKRSYPGNVRELRQLIARIASRHIGKGPVSAGDVPDDERPVGDHLSSDWRNSAFESCVRNALAAGAGLRDISHAAADMAMRIAVSDEDGNLQKAAARLGVTDRALQIRRANGRQAVGNTH
jgi:transcriptional regulator with GAF, ATPase, and Fis domain